MRVQRLVFGEDADLYDQARPSYPDALIDEVVALVGPSARALDVGCGTGKATVLLAGRGLGGVAVEADPAMAAIARRHLVGLGTWRVDVSDFEAWRPAPAPEPFDLICSAQAWHWIDPRVRLSKAHRLLRRRGWLALWWNRPDEDATPIRKAIDEVYGSLAPDLPSGGIGSQGRRVADDLPAELTFRAPIHRGYRWSQPYTAEQWTALLRTQSDHRMLPPERLEPLLVAIRAAIQEHGGIYRHPYLSWLWATQKG